MGNLSNRRHLSLQILLWIFSFQVAQVEIILKTNDMRTDTRDFRGGWMQSMGPQRDIVFFERVHARQVCHSISMESMLFCNIDPGIKCVFKIILFSSNMRDDEKFIRHNTKKAKSWSRSSRCFHSMNVFLKAYLIQSACNATSIVLCSYIKKYI